MVDAMVKPVADDNEPNPSVPSDFHGAGIRGVRAFARCAASIFKPCLAEDLAP